MLQRLLILAGTVCALCATDIPPPAVPNPFNTSESRAIRDVLDESFHKKTSDKLSLEELQALYRKLWNEDQEKRFFDGTPTDPRWAAARQEEEAAEAHTKMIDELRRLGGKVAPGMDDDALKAAITERKEWMRRADREQRAAEEAKRHEVAHGPNPAGAGTATASVQPVTMHLCTGINDISSDGALSALVTESATQPDMTQPERDMVAATAKALVASRAELKKEGGIAMLVSGSGVELWLRLSPSPDDPSRIHCSLTLINPTGKHLHLDHATIAIAGSTHNPATLAIDEAIACPPTAAASSGKGADLVQDDGQQITVSSCVITAME
jgi:hypothetical protein